MYYQPGTVSNYKKMARYQRVISLKIQVGNTNQRNAAEQSRKALFAISNINIKNMSLMFKLSVLFLIHMYAVFHYMDMNCGNFIDVLMLKKYI
jgi:hypothetical protein